MNSRRFLAVAIALGALLAHTAAHAWFFFIIPLPRSTSSPLLSNEICVGENVKAGDKTPGPNGTTLEIQTIVGQVALCHNAPKAPVLAKFVTVPNAQPAPSQSATAQQTSAQPTLKPVIAAPAAVTPIPASGSDATSAKLRSLQSMLKEGLITQEDYETKKRELLKAM